MPILDFDMDIPEITAVPAGEYEVMILAADEKAGKTSGNLFLNLRLEIQGEPMASEVWERLMYPIEADKDGRPKYFSRCVKGFKMLYTAFDMDTEGGVDTDELVGKTGRVLLKEVLNEQTDEPENEVVRFISQK